MTKSLEDVMKTFSPARQKKIKERAEQLIAEEVTLQELRLARELTQTHMAKKLGIAQK